MKKNKNNLNYSWWDNPHQIILISFFWTAKQVMQSILTLKRVKNLCVHSGFHVLLSKFVVIVILALVADSGYFPVFHRIHFYKDNCYKAWMLYSKIESGDSNVNSKFNYIHFTFLLVKNSMKGDMLWKKKQNVFFALFWF